MPADALGDRLRRLRASIATITNARYLESEPIPTPLDGAISELVAIFAAASPAEREPFPRALEPRERGSASV